MNDRWQRHKVSLMILSCQVPIISLWILGFLLEEKWHRLTDDAAGLVMPKFVPRCVPR